MESVIFFYEVPAGRAEEGETYSEAIEREVLEETGYQSKTRPIYLGEFYVNPATQDNKVISYLIPDGYKATEQNLDPTENIDVFTIPIDKVDSLIDNCEIEQMFSTLAFLLYKRYITRKDLNF